jgi:hypothetical protein
MIVSSRSSGEWEAADDVLARAMVQAVSQYLVRTQTCLTLKADMSFIENLPCRGQRCHSQLSSASSNTQNVDVQIKIIHRMLMFKSRFFTDQVRDEPPGGLLSAKSTGIPHQFSVQFHIMKCAVVLPPGAIPMQLRKRSLLQRQIVLPTADDLAVISIGNGTDNAFSQMILLSLSLLSLLLSL